MSILINPDHQSNLAIQNADIDFPPPSQASAFFVPFTKMVTEINLWDHPPRFHTSLLPYNTVFPLWGKLHLSELLQILGRFGALDSGRAPPLASPKIPPSPDNIGQNCIAWPVLRTTW